MPCFPRKKPRVVQPEETVQHKNVHRYGETNIRYVGATLKQEQWRKTLKDPNAGRRLPDPPQEVIVDNTPRQRPPSGRPPRPFETDQYVSSTPRQQPPQPRYKQPLKADFYVSVPIFNETMQHSYRKKNEYVFVDRADDDVSVYHQSLSRASSLKELRSGSLRRPDSSRTHDSQHTQDSLRQHYSGEYYRDGHNRTRPSSLHRHVQRDRRRDGKHKLTSGSEASFNTYSSRGTYGYESETFEEARQLRKARSGSGLNIDSDDEDCR